MKFKPEDFHLYKKQPGIDDWITPEEATGIANAHLKEMLADAPVVQMGEGVEPGEPNLVWYGYGSDPGTHAGRLVCIEPIEKPGDSGEG